MSLPENLKFDPGTFSGVVRLFPLPNLVMFPHVLQPLHVFEPRYCEMLEAALADDRLIAMSLLQPGWESDYEGRPPVYPTACLGQIVTHVRLPDGRHNLLLAGVSRLRLGTDLPVTTLYRSAPATLCVDESTEVNTSTIEALTHRLLAVFRDALPNTKEAQAPLAQLLQHNIDLGALTDVIAYTLDLDLATKIGLLAECSVPARAKQLLARLEGQDAKVRATFPPDFSAN